MEADDRESLIESCLRYMRASVTHEPDEDAEDAWFELDRLIDEQPREAWQIIIEIASRCRNEAECAQLAAGPLTTFMRDRREEFAPQIEEELIRNSGFRTAYAWLQ